MNNIILFLFLPIAKMCMVTFLFMIAAAWRKQQLLVYALFLLLTLIYIDIDIDIEIEGSEKERERKSNKQVMPACREAKPTLHLFNQ